MFGFDEAQQNYNQVQNHSKNEGSLGHEVLAGGASFLAMKEWEDHQRKEGKEVSHSFAKEVIAGIAGGEVDKLAETKGADFVDREEAKHSAKKKAHELYDQQYGQEENYNPKKKGPHHKVKESFESQHGNW